MLLIKPQAVFDTSYLFNRLYVNYNIH